ncbi:type II toxin-antitoxin system RelE/ParE family toxin, partial [Pseudanabaenaceae cyanobacterium LEGE 13415]|nr:type II toxin-antitoxin system RelE/ParE family toxin [Pseudanabaenaceae cyanobacterium LEGE 13415]
RRDFQPVLDQLQYGEILLEQISGIGCLVMKVRIRNSDTQKGKSGGYRLIYWISSANLIVLLDIYSKSDQEDIEVEEIRQIIKGSNSSSESTGD